MCACFYNITHVYQIATEYDVISIFLGLIRLPALLQYCLKIYCVPQRTLYADMVALETPTALMIGTLQSAAKHVCLEKRAMTFLMAL